MRIGLLFRSPRLAGGRGSAPASPIYNATMPNNSPNTAAPLRYGAPISLADARRVMAAAEAEADRQGWPMVIAIVDSTGHLVMLHRLDQAQYGSIEIARQKAETALNFRRPTKLYEDRVAAGGRDPRMLGVSGLLPLEDGDVLIRDGVVVGAIGVSGMQSGQDAQVAAAGVGAL